MGGKIKRGPQGFGGKHKTAGGQAAMIGLDAGFAIRNAGEDLALGRNPVAGIFCRNRSREEERAQRLMQDILELERRITAAMERITYGVEQLAKGSAGASPRAAGAEAASGDAAARIAHLTEALDEERMTNAQLNERLRVLREKAGQGSDEVVADLQAKLATQADELATLRRVLAEAGREIASLRAARTAEAEELAEIVTALDPLVTAASSEAPHA
jgi:chromosome segregation ATPase